MRARRGHAVMLSPETTHAPPIAEQAFSPADGDPRFSRSTPNALFARFEKAQPGVVVGSVSSWHAGVLREKSRKRPVWSPGRDKLLSKLEQKAMAAETAAVEAPAGGLTHVDSPMASKPVIRQDTAVLLPPKRARYSWTAK